MWRRTRSLILLTVLATGCVELTGQRITWNYDAERDVLSILLHYDGIHEHRDGDEDGATQVAEFLAGGDLMLLDWYGHIERKKLAEAANDESEPPARRALIAALASSLRTTAVGHYRDGDGRIGAVQYVEIAGASKLVAAGNAALGEAILTSEPSPEWRRTHARMVPGAKEGRPWIFLEGNAIGIEFPAHLGEWRRNRAAFFAGLADPSDDDERRANRSVLGLGPLSFYEGESGVRVRLGSRSRPVPMRVSLRDRDDGGLDEAVTKAAPLNLDAALADRLLGRVEEEPTPAIAALLAWGPPEDRARALIRRAASSEGEERAAALVKLAEFGAEWNRTVGVPEAPTGGVEEWWAWYDEVLDGPYGD